MALTPKQERFLLYFLTEAKGNATEAARLAGYGGNDHSLRQIGYENLRHPEIAAKIRENLDLFGMTQMEILTELAAIARADWQNFVEVRKNGKGEILEAKINLRDKLEALELLARTQGMLIARQERRVENVEKVQVKEIIVDMVPEEMHDLSDEELRVQHGLRRIERDGRGSLRAAPPPARARES